MEKRQIWRLALKNQGRDDHIFLMQFVSGHVYTGSGLRETFFVFAISKNRIIAVFVGNCAVIDCFWTSVAHIRCFIESSAAFFNKVRACLIAGRTRGAFDATENDLATYIDFSTMISVDAKIMCIVKTTFVIPVADPVQPDFF